jgi:ligand-binding sensor domain-containing protein
VLKRVVLFLLVLAAASRPVQALDPSRTLSDYIVDFWQEDSGLPQKFVYTILPSRDGYIWVGTRGGLARFDGVKFTVYDDRQPNQLKEAEIYSLADAPDGSLWIGTHGGGLSHLKDGVFTEYTTRDGLPNDFVAALAVTQDGTVWMGTQKGLARMKDGRFTAFDEKDGLPSATVNSLFLDPQGVLWIGTHAGLASFAAGRFVNHVTAHPDTLNKRIGAIAGDGRGGLWLGLIGTQTPVMRFKDDRVTVFTHEEMGAGSVVGVSVDPQGTAWFAALDGLYRYRDGRFEKFGAEVSRVSANHTLQASSLHKLQSIATDREGSVWAGTATEGLGRLRDAAFTNVSVPGRDAGDERVSAVFEDRHGAIWLAFDTGGLGRLQDGKWDLFDTTGLRSIDTFVEDAQGTLWVGNEDHLYKFERGAFRVLEGGPAEIGAALLDRDGSLWLGGRNKGLSRYHHGQLTSYGRSEGMPGVQIRGLALDGKGDLWVAMKDGGVAQVHQGKVTAFSEANGLASMAVAAVYVDRDDVVWAATRRGLCRIRDGKIMTYTAAAHGLPANYFYQILEDDKGYLWLTHGRGVARVSRQELNDIAAGQAQTLDAQTFGTESGIKSTAMVVPNQPAAWKARDGRLWFATGRGAAVVDPAALVHNHVVPPVWVEEIRVDKKSYLAKDDTAFAPGAGDVEIHYTGLSLIAPTRVAFKYQLEGFDTRWVDAGTRRVAYYTHLPPGDYRFVVKACNNDGVWNEVGRSVRFRLRPHWYQTEWFRIAAIGMVGLTLLGAHRWRLSQHKRREVELALRVEEAIGHVKTLRGLLPICAGCKKIRDDSGYWNQMETYISDHSGADFSHSMCPDCIARMYPDYASAQEPGRPPTAS